MENLGFEPKTFRLQTEYSTVELVPRYQQDWGDGIRTHEWGIQSSLPYRLATPRNGVCWVALFIFQICFHTATDSSTATLLQLRPSFQTIYHLIGSNYIQWIKKNIILTKTIEGIILLKKKFKQPGFRDVMGSVYRIQ